jgi:hypothetical protein
MGLFGLNGLTDHGRGPVGRRAGRQSSVSLPLAAPPCPCPSSLGHRRLVRRIQIAKLGCVTEGDLKDLGARRIFLFSTSAQKQALYGAYAAYYAAVDVGRPRACVSCLGVLIAASCSVHMPDMHTPQRLSAVFLYVCAIAASSQPVATDHQPWRAVYLPLH